MRTAFSRFLRVGLLVAGAIAIGAGVASAATVTSPSTSPFAVPGNASGAPLPFNVTASGYAPGASVFITQCDGLSPSDPNWSIGIDCDFGMAPGPVTADAGGVATFSGSHQFAPFKSGDNVQGKFNCIGPDDPASTNGLPDWTNCRLRVSTNNSAVTSDQAFLVLTMPDTPGSSSTTTTEGSTTTTASSTSTSTTTVVTTTTTVPASTTTSTTGNSTTSTVARSTTTTLPPCTTTTTGLETSTTAATSTTVACSTTTTFGTQGSTDPTTFVSAGSGSGSGSLPRTGSSPLLPAAGAGVVLIGTGLGIAVSRRRRMA